MREVSELIYETCKTYLATQGKFLMLLECFIAVIIVIYFGVLKGEQVFNVVIILLFSVIGITGSFAVAAFGSHIIFAQQRTRGTSPPRHINATLNRDRYTKKRTARCLTPQRNFRQPCFPPRTPTTWTTRPSWHW